MLHPMKHAVRAVAFALLLLAPYALAAAPAGLKVPVARVEVVRDTLAGQVIEDPYRWLEQ